jgi:SAM-dependent methyltransferase
VLETIFSPGVVEPEPDDVLVDIGSGKGRVLNFWLKRFPNNPIIGIELDEAVADRARHRLRRWKNVRIVTGDAVESIPPEGTIYWMFNPFKESIIRSFSSSLKRASRDVGRVRIVYYKALFAKVFEDDPFWSVQFVDLKLWEPGTGKRDPRVLALIEAAR